MSELHTINHPTMHDRVISIDLCTNGPATFHMLRECVLAGLHWASCLVYHNDTSCLVIGKTFDIRDILYLFVLTRLG